MASAINFPCQAPVANMRLMANQDLTHPSFPFKISRLIQHKKMQTQQYIHLGRVRKQRQYLVMSSADDYSDSTPNPLSASYMIQQFYTYVNDKKLDKLQDHIAESCYFEECSFPQALQGRKEVINFFTQLAEGMGQNVKFKIEDVCKGDANTAAVIWHLEWNREEIPFTRGCSYYECSEEQDQLVIRKARVVIESPIKPGSIVLILLKNVTRLFDDNPKATEWFLRRPHVIANFLLNVYKKILAPFVNPLIAGYITMWSFIARILGLVFTTAMIQQLYAFGLQLTELLAPLMKQLRDANEQPASTT